MTNEYKNVPISAKTSSSIIKKIDEMASRENRTRSNMVDTILREYFK